MLNLMIYRFIEVREMKIYEVYDVNDNKTVFTGIAKEIAKEFDVPTSALYHYKDKCKMHKKYKIRVVGDYVAPRETKKVIKKTKYEKTLDYILRHLKWYGNVYLNENPKKYLGELKELGYKIKVDKYHTVVESDIIINEKLFKRKIKNYQIDYILTHIKG